MKIYVINHYNIQKTKMAPCTITCSIALVIVVAMIIMTFMMSNDSFVQSYRNKMPNDVKNAYDKIVEERKMIYFTGYVIGFVLSALFIVFNINVLKQKMPISAMVCIAIVISTLVNYFYYVLSPKTNYVINLLKTDEQRKDWLHMYRTMQYYYHGSFALGAVAVGVFAYAFRGNCN